MATFKRFEEIIAWQLARELCQAIQEVARTTGLGRDFRLLNQIADSSDSIKNNIAEGHGRGGNAEFIHFLEIAHASCAETQSQLYSLLDRGYVDEQKFRAMYHLAYRTSKAIHKLIAYLQSSPIKGPRYNHRP
ncbi:MAG: four helix bundle protein [Chitinophagaceae bacterium]|nr:MAG: four helix bundle protein [Chitinophagaceae bacterium]